jgi:hypothetical protein
VQARVIDDVDRPCLVEEALGNLGIAGDAAQEEIDSDVPLDLLVDALADGTHAALAELPSDAVATDRLSSHVAPQDRLTLQTQPLA